MIDYLAYSDKLVVFFPSEFLLRDLSSFYALEITQSGDYKFIPIEFEFFEKCSDINEDAPYDVFAKEIINGCFLFARKENIVYDQEKINCDNVVTSLLKKLSSNNNNTPGVIRECYLLVDRNEINEDILKSLISVLIEKFYKDYDYGDIHHLLEYPNYSRNGIVM